jgi:uncharacterized glyoxalase superfamily protein PhnB
MSETVHWVRNPNPETKYTLSASIGLTTVRLRFEAEDDTYAVMHAIREILDRAAMEETYEFDQKFWSKGEIVLTDPNGAVLNTMPLKAAGESDD